MFFYPLSIVVEHNHSRNRLTLIHPTFKYMHTWVRNYILINTTVLTDTLHMQKY